MYLQFSCTAYQLSIVCMCSPHSRGTQYGPCHPAALISSNVLSRHHKRIPPFQGASSAAHKHIHPHSPIFIVPAATRGVVVRIYELRKSILELALRDAGQIMLLVPTLTLCCRALIAQAAMTGQFYNV